MQKILAVILCLTFAESAFSQSAELGIMIGCSTYKGDLNSHLFDTKFVHPAAGIFLRRCLNSFWSFRAGINYGRISADDARSNDEFQKFRNLSFRSDILEANGLFEFNFFPYQTASESSIRATPFLMFGGKAKEALDFYTSIFPKAKIENITFYGEDDSGDVGTVKLANLRSFCRYAHYISIY